MKQSRRSSIINLTAGRRKSWRRAPKDKGRQRYLVEKEDFARLSQQLYQAHAKAVCAEERTEKEWRDQKHNLREKLSKLEKEKKKLESEIIETQRRDRKQNGANDSIRNNAYLPALHALEDQLLKVEDELERMKKKIYFQKCFRFVYGSISAGLFVGIEDLWIEKLECAFDVQICPTDPQVVLRVNGNTGIKNCSKGLRVAFRAMNVKVVRESAAMPSINLQEISVQAEMLTEIPLTFKKHSPLQHAGPEGVGSLEDVEKGGTKRQFGRWKVRKTTKRIKFKLLSLNSQIKGLTNVPPTLVRT